MKGLLKRSGLIFILAGVCILTYSEFSRQESNTLLLWSLALIVLGLLGYIIINSFVEN